MHDDPIKALYDRAEAHSVPMVAICARAKVAATTPSRWKNDRNGATIATIQKLNDALSVILEERGRAAA